MGQTAGQVLFRLPHVDNSRLASTHDLPKLGSSCTTVVIASEADS
jgi:hypothetical protein